MSLFILNFAHPLTSDHLKQVEVLTGQAVARVINIDSQVDSNHSLNSQVVALVSQVGFSAVDWQTLRFVVNPPSLNYITMLLLAELHGRCGYFPAIARLRSVPDSLSPHYEVAEIINLQAVRDKARTKRKQI